MEGPLRLVSSTPLLPLFCPPGALSVSSLLVRSVWAKMHLVEPSFGVQCAQARRLGPGQEEPAWGHWRGLSPGWGAGSRLQVQTSGTRISEQGSWVLCGEHALWRARSGLTRHRPILGAGFGFVLRRSPRMELVRISHRGLDFLLRAPFPLGILDSLLEVSESPLLGSSWRRWEGAGTMKYGGKTLMVLWGAEMKTSFPEAPLLKSLGFFTDRGPRGGARPSCVTKRRYSNPTNWLKLGVTSRTGVVFLTRWPRSAH